MADVEKSRPEPDFGWHPHADSNGALPAPYTIIGPDGENIYIDPREAAGLDERLGAWLPRPADLPDWRQWLVDDWNRYGRLTAIQPLLNSVSAGQHQFKPEWEWRNASEAMLWFVGHEMCDLLAGAAPTMPSAVLTPDLVPDAAGLVVFQTPLAGLDSTGSGLNCNTGAYLWGQALWENTGEPVIGITVYGPGAVDRQYPLMPLGSLVWPYGRSVDDPLTDAQFAQGGDLTDTQVASMCEDRRRLAALWILSSQPGLADPVEARAPNRAVARRFGRSRDGLDPRVKIIQLRQRHRPRDSEAPPPGTRTYRHRWIVEGYWRNQAYGPGYSQHRPKFIESFLKGPAEAPLLRPADKVKSWTR
jgi:hypothetical protein